ncbi:MAG: hypothetical protein JWP31_2183 [Aeromicrobium sp.]|nr:hypothetical protein [Aeromicrobium sp.]
MTGQTPPPPPPPGPPAPPAGPPAPASPATTAPAAGGGKRRGKTWVIGGVVAAIVIAGGAAGSWAVFTKLSGGGPQPHDALPDSVIAYARVDVDPSASQKIEIFQLIREFPDVAKELGIKDDNQDLRELLFDEVEDQCDVTYEDDVEPWLGERVGVALDDDGETPLVAVQYTDKDKAEDGITSLIDCAGGGDLGEDPGVAFNDDQKYVIVSLSQDAADDAVADGKDSPLAADKTFAQDMEDLGDQGVFSAWVNLDEVKKIPAIESGLGELQVDSDEIVGDTRSVAVTFRAADSSLELAGITHHHDKLPEMKASGADKLPESTVAAASFSGGGEQADTYWNELVKGIQSTEDAFTDPFCADYDADGVDDYCDEPGPTFEEQVTSFEDETGLELPADLQTLLGDNLTVALGSAGLENIEEIFSADTPAGLAELDFGIKLTGDQDDAGDLVKRVADYLNNEDFELETAETDDGAVLATSKKAAAELSTDGSLGDQKAFTRVIPDADQATGVFFVDIRSILDTVEDSDVVSPSDKDDIREAKAIQSLGISATRRSDHTTGFSLRVAFDKD